MSPCSCARRLRCLICLDGGAGESARRRGRCSWLAARAVDWLVHGSRHRRNPRVSSSLLGGRMRVSSCDPATRPIRPRPSYRTLNQHHLKRNRKFVDSPLEELGFELAVPLRTERLWAATQALPSRTEPVSGPAFRAAVSDWQRPEAPFAGAGPMVRTRFPPPASPFPRAWWGPRRPCWAKLSTLVEGARLTSTSLWLS